MAIDIFSTRIMLRAIEQLVPPKMFLQETFFPEEEIFTTTHVDIDIRRGKRRLAPFVRPFEAAPLFENLTYQTRKYEPPYLKIKKVSTAADILKRPMGVNPYGIVTSPQAAAAARLGFELQEMIDAIVRRIEAMAAELLRTGIVTVLGDTINEQLDFQMLASHIVTLAGAQLWTNGASDPIGDIITWQDIIVQDSGLAPDVGIMGRDVYKAFINHAKIQAILDNRRMEINRMVREQESQRGEIFIGEIEGIRWFRYNEWFDDPQNPGTLLPMIPVDRVILGATAARNQKLYAGIQDHEAVTPVSWFPKSWIEQDPSRRFLMVQSAALPALSQPDAILSAKAV